MKWKNILTIVLAACVIFGFSAAAILKAPEAYSMAERRSLAQKPEFSSEQLLSGKFMTRFEDFSLDQFPLRDNMRTLKAAASRYVFLQKDNHGIYEQDGKYKMIVFQAESLAPEQTPQSKISHLLATYSHTIFRPVVPVKELFEQILNIGATQHYAIVDGDCREELQYFAKIMGFEFYNIK